MSFSNAGAGCQYARQMKFVLIMIAAAFAATSVVAGSVASRPLDNAGAESAVAAPHACHPENGDNPAGLIGGCDHVAFCNLACGVIAPLMTDRAPSHRFLAALFFTFGAELYGLERKPDAPPPRPDIL